MRYCANHDITEFKKYLNNFTKQIYERRNSDDLKRELLVVGDFSHTDGTGSHNLNGYLERWSFSTQEKSDWKKIFAEKKELVKEYLNGEYNTNEKLSKIHDWTEPFIKYPSIFSYTSSKKFLWDDKKTRVVLLRSHKAGIYSSREMEIHLFHELLSKSWVYRYDVCAQELDFIDNRIKFVDRTQEESNKLFLDVIQEWKDDNYEFQLKVGFRKEEEEKKFKSLIKFLDENNWSTEGETNRAKYHEPFYKQDKSISIIANVEKAFETFCTILKLH